MANLTAYNSITAIIDGDQIASALFSTRPLKQNVKLGTDSVYPDWTKKEEQPVIYPRIQSQNTGLRVKVKAGTEKWMYNDSEVKFDSTGLSLDKKFKKETYTDGTIQVPSLRIVGNLASIGNTSSDKIDFFGVVEIGGYKASVTPSTSISLEEVAGDPYDSFINATNGGVIDNVTDNTVLTAYLRKGGSNVTEGVTYKWYMDTESGYKPINSDGGKPNKKTIKETDVESNLVVKVEFVVGGEIISMATIQLYDETDPLVINTRPSGPLQLGYGDSVTFNPVVVRRDKEITISGYTFKFVVYNANSELTKETTADKYTITHDDVLANMNSIRLHVHGIKK